MRENTRKRHGRISGLPESSQGFQRYRNDCQFKIFYIMTKKTKFMRENTRKRHGRISGLPESSQGFQRYRNDCQFKIFYIMTKKKEISA